MRKHKRIVLAVFTIFLIASLAATAAAQTEIVVMGHWSQQQERHVTPYFREYEELTGIKVRYEPVSFGELLTRILVGTVSGVRPDVYHIYNAWLPQFSENNVLAVPPAEIQEHIRANFSASAVEGTTYDGVLWGYPTEINTYALVYNERILKEEGYDRPPQTWDELKEYAENLTQRDRRDNVTRAGFASWVGDVSGVVHPFYSLLIANGGRILNEDNTKAAFNSPEGLEALELYNDIVASPAFTVYEDLAVGGVVMGIFAPWGKLYFEDQMGPMFDELRTAPIPAGRSGNTGTVTYGWSFVVDAASTKKDEAWEFVKWLNSVTEGRTTSRMGDFLANNLGALPAGIADQENHPDSLAHPFIKTYVDILEYGQPEPLIVPAAEINAAVQAEIEAMFNGLKTPAEALADAEARVNEILAGN